MANLSPEHSMKTFWPTEQAQSKAGEKNCSCDLTHQVGGCLMYNSANFPGALTSKAKKQSEFQRA